MRTSSSCFVVLLCALAACGSPPPDPVGRWGPSDRYQGREWIDFREDGTFEITSYMEYPEAGERVPGTYMVDGDSLRLTSSGGITGVGYFDGDVLVLAGARYQRIDPSAPPKPPAAP